MTMIMGVDCGVGESKTFYSYPYPRPVVTVDAAVFAFVNDRPMLLLVKRGEGPFEDCWALPGGYVNEGEDLGVAAARELQEETGLCDTPLCQVYTFGEPGRDPRGWVISVAFVGVTKGGMRPVKAADDAVEAQWFDIDKLPTMAFDHAKIARWCMLACLHMVGNGGRDRVAAIKD